MSTNISSGGRPRRFAGLTNVAASLIGCVFTLKEGTNVLIISCRSPEPWLTKSDPEITSTGAGESPIERASRRVPVTTTSSTSFAPKALKGRAGVRMRANAVKLPNSWDLSINLKSIFIEYLHIYFTHGLPFPQQLRNPLSVPQRAFTPYFFTFAERPPAQPITPSNQAHFGPGANFAKFFRKTPDFIHISNRPSPVLCLSGTPTSSRRAIGHEL